MKFCKITCLKDYLDLYYLLTYKEYSNSILKQAIINTFKKRNTDIGEAETVILEIENSDFTKELWNEYRKKFKYAINIEYVQIIEKLKLLVDNFQKANI